MIQKVINRVAHNVSKTIMIAILAMCITSAANAQQIEIGQSAEVVRRIIQENVRIANHRGRAQTYRTSYIDGRIAMVTHCVRNQLFVNLRMNVHFCRTYFMVDGRLGYTITQYENVPIGRLLETKTAMWSANRIINTYYFFDESFEFVEIIYLAQNGLATVKRERVSASILLSNDVRAEIENRRRIQEIERVERRREQFEREERQAEERRREAEEQLRLAEEEQIRQQEEFDRWVSQESVVVNGVRWAMRNVNTPGTFVDNISDRGAYFHWANRRRMVITGTNTRVRNNNPCPPGWRIPTYQEFQSLGRGTRKVINGVLGALYGTVPNQIFLPATFQMSPHRAIVGLYETQRTRWQFNIVEDRHHTFPTEFFTGGEFRRDSAVNSFVRCVTDN